MQLMHNLQIRVGELYRLNIGGGGTPFPRVPPYFDHWSQTCIVSKRLNILSKFFHCLIATTF